MTPAPAPRLPILFSFLLAAAALAAPPDSCDVVWHSPSADHHGSMPLGNGATSVNAWINPAGELEFYIGRTDSWGDNARLLKLGKVRIALDPPPPVEPFSQTLRLGDATMLVRYGAGPSATILRLWVDANHPVIHVTVDSPRPVTATATIELWRTEPVTLPVLRSDVLFDKSKPRNEQQRTRVEPDTLLAGQPGRIGWYHRNIKSVGPAVHAAVQDTAGHPRPDPLLQRTFGAIITAEGGRSLGDTRLQSPPGTRHRFGIFADTMHPATEAEWLARMESHLARAAATPFEARRKAHEDWWNERWKRSWILAGKPGAKGADGAPDDARTVTRAYALQRFIDICGGRGAYPIKFNGSIFTVPSEGSPGDADYRRWGPCYYWQNTRLPYISMCTSGDTDLMAPLFAQYIDRFLPLNLYRTRHYFNHRGAYFIECVHFWGDVSNKSYGWTPATERSDKLQQSGYHKREWVAGPELVSMALDYHDHTGDDAFLHHKVLPTADAVLRFFDEHYRTDQDGRLVMHPSQALETWWDTTNPMPELAGLTYVTRRLLALPEELTTPDQRAFWSAFLRKLPPLPTCEAGGKPAFAPAARFEDKHNTELPELYCVFPFRLASFNRPNAALAINAFEHRRDRGHSGWCQDDLFAACLGLTDQTRDLLVRRARSHHEGSRFPAFWGPNHDWIPDQDHGGVLMKTFQAMVLQTEPASGEACDGRIHLLPAWPRDWDLDFKLHAPGNTTVEGRYHHGTIEFLRVTPPERRKDIRLPADLKLE